jgi:hypothetical protein
MLLAGNNAIAQQAVIEHCKQTSSDADRIACLEAALLGKSFESAPAAQIDPPSMDIEAGPADVPVDPAKATQATGTAAIIAASADATPQGIGADQVIARNETREEQLKKLEKAEGLAVAAYAVVPFEKLQVTLENGQVWRQIKGDTQKFRVDLERNQTVDIEESAISGYKLRFNEMGRTIRVERVQ